MKDSNEEIVYEIICESNPTTLDKIEESSKLKNTAIMKAVKSLKKKGLISIGNPKEEFYPVKFNEILKKCKVKF